MASSQVTVLAMFKAKSGLEERVREELLKLVAPTRSESGCINYDLHQCSDDKTKFMLHENWVSKRDLDIHLEMPYLNHFKSIAGEILAEPLQITIWKMISSKTR
ncbi:MAG: putative quinol monooxygenase [Desulfobacterales bacterium]